KLFNIFRRNSAPVARPVSVVSADVPVASPQKISSTARVRPKVFSPFSRGRPFFKEPPPPAAGNYTIVLKKTGTKVYRGTAVDLLSRYRSHVRSGKFDPQKHRFEYQHAKVDATDDALHAWETKKIKRHKPSGNKRAGGGGRRSKHGPR